MTLEPRPAASPTLFSMTKAQLQVGVAKKGLPLPLHPSEGLWYLSGRARLPALLILFNFMLQSLNSRQVQPGDWRDLELLSFFQTVFIGQALSQVQQAKSARTPISFTPAHM